MVDYDELRREFIKCVSDKSRIYMIENYLKTYDMRYRKEVPFKLFPRQKDLCKLLGNEKNVITTKPRQAGITTTTAAFIACTMALASEESPETVLVIGNKLDLSEQMVTKVRDFLNQIPRWFWGDDYFSPDPKSEKNKIDIFTKNNKDEVCLFNKSKIIARSSGKNAARGVSSVSILVFDEAAFIENGDVVYSQAVATTSTCGRIVMISTPGGKDQLYWKTYSQAKNGENGFALIELKWYQDPRYNKNLEWYYKDKESGEIKVIKEETLDESGSIRYDEKHWEEMVQKGYKPRSPWYLDMCGKFNNDEQKIAQELDVSFLGSVSNVVAPEFIEMQENMNTREPMKKGEDGDPFGLEETWIWKPAIPGHKYLMSVDCSRGDAADRTAIEILDLTAHDEETGTPCIEQVLEYHGKRTGDDIGEIAYVYGRMYGNAFCTVDCVGGTGDACVLTMQRLGYTNLYYDDPQLNKYTMEREATSLKPNKEGKLPGFHSNAVRFQMLTFFANMVRTNQIRIRSKRVISELETWIYKGEAARIDHMDGMHDDTLTCLAMGVFVAQYHLGDLEKAKERDAAYLRAWVNSTRVKQEIDNQRSNREYSIDPRVKKYNAPFYSTETLFKTSGNPHADSMRWLIK